MASSGFNRFAEITGQMHKAISQIVHDTCQDLDDMYAGTAARDTGFMASSAYISTVQEDTYGEDWEGGTEAAWANAFPDIGPPENDTTGYMAVAANYSPFVELGSRHGPPQPAFYPAVEMIRPQFISAIGNLESYLR